MAVVGVELETLVSELDALTIRPPPCCLNFCFLISEKRWLVFAKLN